MRLLHAALLIFALGLVGAAPASATISFAEPVRFAAGAEPSELVVGDWNGDGLPDVATANAASGDVSVLIGDGTGKLGIPVVRPVGGTPTDVAAGDVDRDGNRDLVVATQDPAGVVLMRGLGGGTFGNSSVIPVGAPAVRVAVGDVNGDSFLDIVTTNARRAGLQVTVVLGNGTGAFSAPSGYDVTGPPADVALGDVTGDGAVDILTADRQPAALTLLPGAGDGTFLPQRSAPLGGLATSLALGDVTGDSEFEAAITRVQAGTTVVIGDGRGNLVSNETFPTGLDPTVDAIVGDFDNDGRPDVANYGSGLSVLRSLGGGTFEDAAPYSAPGGSAVATGDIDRDGAPDVVLASGSEIVLLANTSVLRLADLPAPEVGETANVAPARGTVRVRVPGTNRFVDLARADQIPIGSELDTRKGSVRLVTAAGGASGAGSDSGEVKTQSGTFRGGLFKLGQSKGARPFTTLRLSQRLRCTRSRRAGSSGARDGVTSARRRRRLFGNARGRFRTRGRHSTASVRGTRWLVKDSCRGTTTVVQSGRVVVQDLVKKRRFTLTKGERYTARPRRR